jgi:hypothetical protein
MIGVKLIHFDTVSLSLKPPTFIKLPIFLTTKKALPKNNKIIQNSFNIKQHCFLALNPSLAPSLNTQSCNRRPLCSTFTFENLRSPKKNNFYSKKNSKFSFFFFFFLNLLCNFLVQDAIVFSKKNLNFFLPRKHEKTTLKSCS